MFTNILNPTEALGTKGRRARVLLCDNNGMSLLKFPRTQTDYVIKRHFLLSDNGHKYIEYINMFK